MNTANDDRIKEGLRQTLRDLSGLHGVPVSNRRWFATRGSDLQVLSNKWKRIAMAMSQPQSAATSTRRFS